MAVPLLDLTRQLKTLSSELESAVLSVMRSGKFILGEEVTAFEEEAAAYLGCKHVIGLSSGTDALLAALMALDIGPGDEVIVPVYSFFATAGAVSRLGATPVFIDVEPEFANMDPVALEAALKAGGDKVKAVIVVHLFGAAADMNPIMKSCKAHGVPVIEDAAQAIGTRADVEGAKSRMAGTWGLGGCFSTFPSKNLGGAGDGGFLSTDDDEFAQKIKHLRNHGQTHAYKHTIVGANFRLDAIQAAVLRVKLRHLESFTDNRRANALRYAEQFNCDELRPFICPPLDVADRHVYHQYVAHVRDGCRDDAVAFLREANIGCNIYYPISFHEQPCFADLGYKLGQFPVAEALTRTNIALPIFPELTTAEHDEVISGLKQAAARSSRKINA